MPFEKVNVQISVEEMERVRELKNSNITQVAIFRRGLESYEQELKQQHDGPQTSQSKG